MAKFKRKMISLETKLQILDKLKFGVGSSAVAKQFDLNEATVRTIKKNEEKIRACVAAGSSLHMKRTSYVRGTTMGLMEKALILWVEENIHKKMPIDSKTIRHKAVNIFNSIMAKQSFRSDKSIEFSGSKGWFEKFKKRYSLNNDKLKGEFTSIDEKGNLKSCKGLNKSEENTYNSGQMVATEITDLSWKKMAYINYPYQTESSVVEFDALCSHASSDSLTKPTNFNHSLNGCDADLSRNNTPTVESICYIPTLENEYSEIARLQHQAGEELDGTTSNEFNDSDTELNASELVETVIDSTSSKCEVDSDESVPKFTLDILDKGLTLAKELEIFFVENDPNIERRLKFQSELYECLAPYNKIQEGLNEDSSQTLITDFFKTRSVIPQQKKIEKNSELEQITYHITHEDLNKNLITDFFHKVPVISQENKLEKNSDPEQIISYNVAIKEKRKNFTNEAEIE